MMMATLVVSLLTGAAHGEHPASAAATKNNRIAAIARIARAGDLAVAGMAEGSKEPRAVLDVDAAGCSVAFKTATSSTGFRAQIADFSRDLTIIAVGANEVQITDRAHPPDGLILRAQHNATILRDELLGIHDACRTSDILF